MHNCNLYDLIEVFSSPGRAQKAAVRLLALALSVNGPDIICASVKSDMLDTAIAIGLSTSQDAKDLKYFKELQEKGLPGVRTAGGCVGEAGGGLFKKFEQALSGVAIWFLGSFQDEDSGVGMDRETGTTI